VDHTWLSHPELGNVVVGLAAAGAVLLAVGHPGGAAAVGAGLVAFAGPLPFQLRAGEFGYYGWVVVVTGGVLLTLGGGLGLCAGAREVGPTTPGPADPHTTADRGLDNP
jgi:hypothetical protein